MKNKSLILAYNIEDKSAAQRMEADLTKVGINFRHMTCGANSPKKSFGKDLLKTEGIIFILISDHFLKSNDCMADMLALFSKGLQQNNIQAILVDTAVKDDKGNVQRSIPTQIARISDLINYMNYWQEQYLKLRKEKSNITKSEMDAFELELKRARMISAEVGEFLRILRDTDYWIFHDLKQNHYEAFFNKIGKEDLLIPFQKNVGEARSEEELIEAVKKELDIAPSPSEKTPTDPEELEAIRMSQLDRETNEKEHDAKKAKTMSSSLLSRFFQRIDQLLAQDDEATAFKELRQFISANPEVGEAHHRLSLLEVGNEHFAEARKHAEYATELEPKNGTYFLHLGKVLFHHFKDQAELAEKALKKATALSPTNVEAHYQYGILLYEVLGKTKKAIKHLELVLALQPQHPFANYDLALIYYGMRKKKKAAMYYEKAFEINKELRTPENDLAFWYNDYAQEKFVAPAPDEDELSLLAPEEELKIQQILADAVVDEQEDDFQRAEADTSEGITEVGTGTTDEGLNPAPIEDSSSPQLGKPKTILITGATSGIGKATATRFAADGHRLILTGRREHRLLELKARLLSEYNIDILPLTFDVRYLSATKKCVESLPAEWRDIDLLVNNAGLAKGLSPIHEDDVRHWEIMLDTNVKGLLFVTKLIAPRMVERRQGQIINVCSSAGHEVYPNGAVYCATKHAVDALTKGMRLDLHKFGIRVGQVSPGHVEETEFALVRFDGDKDRAKIYEDFQPLRSSDVADAIHYMATRPAHVTIQDIILMGTQQASSVFIHRSGRGMEEV